METSAVMRAYHIGHWLLMDSWVWGEKKADISRQISGQSPLEWNIPDPVWISSFSCQPDTKITDRKLWQIYIYICFSTLAFWLWIVITTSKIYIYIYTYLYWCGSKLESILNWLPSESKLDWRFWITTYHIWNRNDINMKFWTLDWI